MDEEEEVLGEDSLKRSDDELDISPEGMEDDFGLEDPDDNYH